MIERPLKGEGFMLCQNAKRVANIQFTQIINNNKHVLYLCEKLCQEEGKLKIGPPFSINDFSGIMGFHICHQFRPIARKLYVIHVNEL